MTTVYNFLRGIVVITTALCLFTIPAALALAAGVLVFRWVTG